MTAGFLGEMRVNDWSSCLSLGINWEEKLKIKIGHIRQVQEIKQIDYSKNPELQKKGVDLRLKTVNEDIDIKTREFYSYKWKDILLETLSVVEKDILGWFYTTQAHIISYVWLNESKTNLIDGYLIFITPQLRKWFDQNKHRFRIKIAHSNNDGEIWSTENYAVPISAFPKGSIIRFNPHLNLSQQSNLLFFFNPKSKRNTLLQTEET